MPAATAQTFIAKWRKASGSERANYQLFITELCELLGCDKTDPSSEDNRYADCFCNEVSEERVWRRRGYDLCV